MPALSKPQEPHRVTIYPAAGGWRFRVQSKNWRVIAAPEVTAEKRATLERLVARRFPNVEVVIES